MAAGAAGPAGAAGTGPGRDFNSWLGQRLRELPADEAVYTEYITGLLLTEDEPREIRQALTDLLADILVKVYFNN